MNVDNNGMDMINSVFSFEGILILMFVLVSVVAISKSSHAKAKANAKQAIDVANSLRNLKEETKQTIDSEIASLQKFIEQKMDNQLENTQRGEKIQ